MLESVPCNAKPTATPADPNNAIKELTSTPICATAIKITIQRNPILMKEQENEITP